MKTHHNSILSLALRELTTLNNCGMKHFSVTPHKLQCTMHSVSDTQETICCNSSWDHTFCLGREYGFFQRASEQACLLAAFQQFSCAVLY